ncbi:phosphonoacetaldehyde reductase [Natronoglycomyces albus]|uniref:Phosphonoacetaldehyde reductase n=1 Tax=Natronoglycomyces albus TaxID=2811108 RepID=A0A895XG10_9ACTN|nr:phosphonoacetaldehyde reductase [Natronoglycomyces albus]QSB04801.1 phosphonoacetaldehyde reductase [Natronoglycomyces albus]
MSALADRDIRFGDNTIAMAPNVVRQLGATRVLVVCGKNSFTASGAEAIVPELENVAQVRRWNDFRANTDAADLIVGLRIVEEFQPDAILAVGGGSAMDMAKLLCGYRGVTDKKLLEDAIRAGGTVSRTNTALILAPTTSGSGAEATHFGVVYIGADKYSIGGPTILPDVVLLDPSLTLSGSDYQRATSGVDALAQAIEALWAVDATDESHAFALQALPLLAGSLEAYVKSPSAKAARDMALGSYLAGRAIDIAKTTAAHALSYGITKTYGLSHGHAVAVTLGSFIEQHAEASASRLQDAVDPMAHRQAMDEVLAALGAANAAEAKESWAELLQRIGLDASLTNAGARRTEDRHKLANSVNLDRLGNNPVKFTLDELAELLIDLP